MPATSSNPVTGRAPGVFVIRHRSKLDQLKRFSTESGANLSEQNGAAQSQSNDNRENQQEWTESHYCY
jgi:hypothetical protein